MFSLLEKALEVFLGLGHLPLNYFSDPPPLPQLLLISPFMAKRNDAFSLETWVYTSLDLTCCLLSVSVLTLCSFERCVTITF